MSHNSIDELADEVRECIENNTGTQLADVLEFAWKLRDFDTVREILVKARQQEEEYEYRAA
jgi:BMFP domain-containing protein YqiC